MERACATRFIMSTGLLALKRTGLPKREPDIVKYCTLRRLRRARMQQVRARNSSGIALTTQTVGVHDGPGRRRAQVFDPSSGMATHSRSSPGILKQINKPTSSRNSSRTGSISARSHASTGRLAIAFARCCRSPIVAR